jgi:hypothetical protein
MKGIADWKMKECEPLAAPTTYTRVDEDFEMELEGLEIAVAVASFDVIFADVVALDPVSKLNDSVGVEAAPEVGEVSESEFCPVAVFEGLLVSLFTTQHASVPSSW